MKVVTFASSKGGVGKTTLAFNTAIHAARAGAGVQLADRDPQGSLMHLCELRNETPELISDNPMLLSGVETVASTVKLLTHAGYDREFLLVDTAGAFMEILSEAIGMADVVVLPLRASPLDVMANEAVVDIATKLGKIERTLFVINMADARSPLLADTLKAVRRLSPNNKPLVIAQRQDYARAAVTARAGIEVNREAAAEISTLWNAIKRIANDDQATIQRQRRSTSKRARKTRSGNPRKG